MVKKSEGYSVEQLERLYSFLSQCVYQHRREYDKTRLLEVRQNQSNVRVSVSRLTTGNITFNYQIQKTLNYMNFIYDFIFSLEAARPFVIFEADLDQ